MQINEKDKQFLALYSDSEYEKPSVTVDAVIFRLIDKEENNYRKLPQKQLQIFLSKRNYSPYIDCYSVIGTFINLENELTDTVKLCVKNKVDLTNYYCEQLYTFGDKSRDPRTRVLSVSYMLLTNHQENLKNGEWFDVNFNYVNCNNYKLPNGYVVEKDIIITLNGSVTFEEKLHLKIVKDGIKETKELSIVSTSLAFDHIKLILQAYERLKNKLEYTDIIFNLLPQKFTLTELKMAYEEILSEKLLDANFRRKTAKFVTPLNEFSTGKGHRSSQLFVHNPLWTEINFD